MSCFHLLSKRLNYPYLFHICTKLPFYGIDNIITISDFRVLRYLFVNPFVNILIRYSESLVAATRYGRTSKFVELENINIIKTLLHVVDK